ncbi:hypothetical protein RHMOL_Rhmol13G0097500 [Rhododendron molle]|uniref:Uncharacterized protein n=1 Tax=Rhododendron molle TaxID=49168 RepID=A0ACC0L600_RHOML|nr:hypothetical protein RHMOL_Rhmol13G0097500 [Rhododendron molle]
MAGIRINKKFTSLLVEGGGYEKLGFSEQDCRNHRPEFLRLKLQEGDATAVHNYFGKMQLITLSFYYAMDVNEKGSIAECILGRCKKYGGSSRCYYKNCGTT